MNEIILFQVKDLGSILDNTFFIMSLQFPFKGVCDEFKCWPRPSQPQVPQNVAFFGNRVIANVINMKLLRWVLIQYDWCPHWKGKLAADMHARWMPCEDRGRSYGDAPTIPGAARGPARQKPWGRFSPTALERNQPCWHLGLGLLGLQNSETINSYCLSHLVGGSSLLHL